MKVHDILSAKSARLVAISPDASLQEVCRTIRRERIGMLLVTQDDGKVTGVISERDVVCFVALHGANAVGAQAAAAMTPPQIVSPEDAVTHVMRVMTEERVRHMLVQSNDEVVGVISIGDILKSRVMEKDQEAAVLRDIARMSFITTA